MMAFVPPALSDDALLALVCVVSAGVCVLVGRWQWRAWRASVRSDRALASEVWAHTCPDEVAP